LSTSNRRSSCSASVKSVLVAVHAIFEIWCKRLSGTPKCPSSVLMVAMAFLCACSSFFISSCCRVQIWKGFSSSSLRDSNRVPSRSDFLRSSLLSSALFMSSWTLCGFWSRTRLLIHPPSPPTRTSFWKSSMSVDGGFCLPTAPMHAHEHDALSGQSSRQAHTSAHTRTCGGTQKGVEGVQPPAPPSTCLHTPERGPDVDSRTHANMHTHERREGGYRAGIRAFGNLQLQPLLLLRLHPLHLQPERARRWVGDAVFKREWFLLRRRALSLGWRRPHELFERVVALANVHSRSLALRPRLLLLLPRTRV